MNIEFDQVVMENRNGYEVGRLRTAYSTTIVVSRRLRRSGLEVLIDDLGVKQDKFLYGDKIYRVDIYDFDKIGIRMPDGNAPGTVDELWRPGGYLRPIYNLRTGEKIYPRETMYFKLDGTKFVHNNNWDTFVSIFEEVGTVTRIYP